MLQTSNLAVLLIFFLLFLFLVLTKCQVLNLRVGRSRDQVLQRAHSFGKMVGAQTISFIYISVQISPKWNITGVPHSLGEITDFKIQLDVVSATLVSLLIC